MLIFYSQQSILGVVKWHFWNKHCASISLLWPHLIQHLGYNVLYGYASNNPEKHQFTQLLFFGKFSYPECAFSVLDTAGKYAGYEKADWCLLAKTLISPYESRMFHSQTHLWKHFVCSFFFTTINSWCKQVSFLKETQCLDLLTSSCNRTHKFIMCGMGMPLMT